MSYLQIGDAQVEWTTILLVLVIGVAVFLVWNIWHQFR